MIKLFLIFCCEIQPFFRLKHGPFAGGVGDLLFPVGHAFGQMSVLPHGFVFELANFR